ncbi:MAG: SIMPL domain-containing protein [Candidatus Gastranaerophilales bacterium]|nr:SIMPL domain-containing protein [Candidatus Gastranaerophilales bacterium]
MLEKIKDFQITIVGIIIAFGLIFCSMIISNNIKKDGIYVTGSAYEIVKSDSAAWTIQINTRGATIANAYSKMQKDIPVVTNYLISKGITKEQIDILPASNYPTYRNDPKTGNTTNDIAYYNYYQNIKVTSNDVNLIKNLSTAVQALSAQDIELTSNPPEYQYSKMADLKVKLLEEATLDSKNRAKAMLKANHNRVGKIKDVKMGVFQITAPDSNSVSDMGVNDATTIDKKVTAVANVYFQIK